MKDLVLVAWNDDPMAMELLQQIVELQSEVQARTIRRGETVGQDSIFVFTADKSVGGTVLGYDILLTNNTLTGLNGIGTQRVLAVENYVGMKKRVEKRRPEQVFADLMKVMRETISGRNPCSLYWGIKYEPSKEKSPKMSKPSGGWSRPYALPK